MASSSSSSSSSPLPFHASFTAENRLLFDYQAAVCRIVRAEDNVARAQEIKTNF